MSEEDQPPQSDEKRAALVAVFLMLFGVTMLTVGISLTYGVPIALIVLGALVTAGGALLGLTS